MFNKKNKKGFTLAELLIVVAIIAILVAIMFPVFGSAMDKAKVEKDAANIRSALSECITTAMTGDFSGTITITMNPTLPIDGTSSSKTLTFKLGTTSVVTVEEIQSKVSFTAGTSGSNGTITVENSSGTVSQDIPVDGNITIN